MEFFRVKNMEESWLLSTPMSLSWRRPLSYRNQSIDLLDKSTDWSLYDNGPRHERVNANTPTLKTRETKTQRELDIVTDEMTNTLEHFEKKIEKKTRQLQ